MTDDEHVEYVPPTTFTHTRPASVMLRFPKSWGLGRGEGVALPEFREFVRRVKAGAYDHICEEDSDGELGSAVGAVAVGVAVAGDGGPPAHAGDERDRGGAKGDA